MFGDLMVFPGDPRFKEARVTVLKSTRICHQITEHVLPVTQDQNLSSQMHMDVHDLPPRLESSEHHHALTVGADTGFTFFAYSSKRNHVQCIVVLIEPDGGGRQS